MQSFLLNFLKNPTQDLTQLQTSIQDFWDELPAYNATRTELQLSLAAG